MCQYEVETIQYYSDICIMNASSSSYSTIYYLMTDTEVSVAELTKEGEVEAGQGQGQIPGSISGAAVHADIIDEMQNQINGLQSSEGACMPISSLSSHFISSHSLFFSFFSFLSLVFLPHFLNAVVLNHHVTYSHRISLSGFIAVDGLRQQVMTLWGDKAALEAQMNTLIEHSAGKERQLITAADDTTVLQDRLLSSEKAAVAAQSRASELSKVLRVSQIRSEELQEEIKR